MRHTLEEGPTRRAMETKHPLGLKYLSCISYLNCISHASSDGDQAPVGPVSTVHLPCLRASIRGMRGMLTHRPDPRRLACPILLTDPHLNLLQHPASVRPASQPNTQQLTDMTLCLPTLSPSTHLLLNTHSPHTLPHHHHHSPAPSLPTHPKTTR